MGFYWVKTNSFIKKYFSNYYWDLPNHQNKVYLTFDDGPTPEITQWVLEQLEKFNAKATFFCIGKNIKNNPDILLKIKSSGHATGNHTFNHTNGWQTTTKNYIEEVTACEAILNKNAINSNLFFRPPYGKIKKSQSSKLRKMGYKIIMWDVLSADFDQNITPEKCLQNVIKNVKSGSIIVFHDSIKASQNLKFVLPKTLEFLSKNNFIFEIIQ